MLDQPLGDSWLFLLSLILTFHNDLLAQNRQPWSFLTFLKVLIYFSSHWKNENCSFVSSFQMPLFWTLLAAFLTMCYMFLSVCLFRFMCRIHCFRYRAWLLNTYCGLFRIASPVHLCPSRFYASLPCSLHEC